LCDLSRDDFRGDGKYRIPMKGRNKPMPNAHILIVEDDTLDVTYLQEALKISGYEVIAVVASGELAVQAAAADPPDVVLMDITLAGQIDGIEAAVQIRTHQDIPIIYLTAHSEVELVNRVKATAPFGYLLKPFHEQELRMAIDMAIYKHKLEIDLKETNHRLEQEITERKQAEESLRESESKLKAAQKMGRIGYREFEIDTQKITWSEQVFNMYDRDPILGPPTPEEEATYYAPEQAQILRDYAQKAIETGAEFKYDLQAQLPGGRTVDFSASMSPVKDKNGRIVKLFGTVQDITDRKRAEEVLRESEETYRALFEQSLVGIGLASLDGKIMAVNKTMEAITGYSGEELQKIHLADTYENPEDRKALLEAITRDGHVVNYPVRLMRQDGTPYEALLSITVIHSGGQQFLQTICIDITARKQAETKIKHINAVLRAIRTVNQLIVRERDRDLLIQGACDNLVETRGFSTAKIVLLDASRKPIKAVEAGLGAQFRPFVTLLESGHLPYCFRQGLAQSEIVLIENPLAVCGDCPLVSAFEQDRKMIVRLEHAGKFYGLLTVSLPRTFAVDEEEQALLREVAGDLAFALHDIELEEKRKRAEEALHKSQSLLQATGRIAKVGGWEFDVETLEQVWTEEVYHIHEVDLDYKPTVSKGINFYAPESRPMIAQAVQKAIDDGKPFDLELQFITAKANHRWVHAIGKAHQKDGKTIKVSGTFQDITERKQAEELLRKLVTAVEIMKLGLTITDLDGVIIYTNVAEAAMHGYRIEELLGQKANLLAPPELRKPLTLEQIQHWQGLMRESVNLRQDGSMFPVWLSSEIVKDDKGRPCAIVTTCEDITERKQAEEELRKSREQLRDLTARLSEVEETERQRIARELHDRVGQNLTALSINLSILYSLLPSELAVEIGDRLTDSQNLIEETTEVIRTVMAELRPSVLDDYGLLATLRWYGELFAKRTGIPVVVQGEDWSPGLATIIETALFRITQEALTNVARHARATQVTISLDKDAEKTVLSIVDDGIGFDPATLPGATWGLIAMRERAFTIGGRLDIDSAPGNGTKIRVEIG
jgi:PAS domain S-box-containing protein